MTPIEVAPQRPDPALPGADWADSFEIEVHGPQLPVRRYAEASLGAMPPWAQRLLHLRNLLVRPFGLKAEGRAGPAGKIGIFPVVTDSHDRIVMGFDDSHLAFRVVIARQGGRNVIRATTLVQRNNLFGRIYIAVITPFHRAIVKAALRSMARMGQP